MTLKRRTSKALEAARALGVEDSLVDFEGLTPQMIEALAEDGVKTLEDFATCADWELAGGWTTSMASASKDDGVLETIRSDPGRSAEHGHDGPRYAGLG